MIKRVLKYGTGEEIPEGSVWLCTRAGTDTTFYATPDEEQKKQGIEGIQQRHDNLIWHYFLVECDADGKPPATKEHQ